MIKNNIKKDKFKIPKELAKAIEDMRLLEHSNEDIVSRYMEGLSKPTPMSIINHHMNELGFDNFLSVLVNGYEIQLSPEEEVKKFYDSVAGQGDYGGITQEAIEKTLNFLGKKIEGINA